MKILECGTIDFSTLIMVYYISQIYFLLGTVKITYVKLEEKFNLINAVLISIITDLNLIKHKYHSHLPKLVTPPFHKPYT